MRLNIRAGAANVPHRALVVKLKTPGCYEYFGSKNVLYELR